MSIVAEARKWWTAIVHGARVRGEVEEELQFHLKAYTDDLILSGIPEKEARRKASLELGRADTQNEKYRESIGLRLFDEIGSDLRWGLRSLWKQPLFTAVTIFSLALGIGATVAMFSLIYAVLIHPFPYADSGRIMNPVIINEERPDELRWFALTKSQFETLRQSPAIESLLGFRNVNMELIGHDLPEDVAAIYLTENANSFFAVPALLGRGIQASDTEAGGQPVVVLNYRFWRRHFVGDPSVVGRAIQLDHSTYTIVGVMPESFAFNDTTGVGDVYLPRSLLHDTTNPVIHWPYTPWIKIKKNVSLETADAELGAIVRQFARDFPNRFPKKYHLELQPIIVPYERGATHALMVLFAGVVLLLIIGCANCSILLLARGEARRRELALRVAIGASRWRIIRQVLVESIVVSFSGAILGVAASYWLAQLPLQLSPSSFPAESVIHVNIPILAFSVALALVCGISFGLVPALRLSRTDSNTAAQSTVRRLPGNPRRRKFNPLIAGQIAFTLILMATAGRAITEFVHLTRIPLGFDPKNVMMAGIVMHWNDPLQWRTIESRVARSAFIDQVKQAIAAVPGVVSVAVGTDATPPFSGIERGIDVAGSLNSEQQQARVNLVSPEFFSTLHIPLVEGRVWGAAEDARGDFVAVVNQAFANRYWTHQKSVDRQVRIPGLKSGGPLESVSAQSTGWRQVIGIVGDARNDGLSHPVLPAIYVPYSTYMAPYAQFEIRTRGEPPAMLRSIRAAVQSVSSEQQISNGTLSLEEVIERDSQWSRQQLFSTLFGIFAAIALTLALVGLFSVVCYSVTQRISEFGIRTALGATRTHILWVASRVALVSACGGIFLGLLVDLLLAQLLGRWMQTGPFGFPALLNVTLLLAVCAASACLVPARRATSIQPVEALRCE